MHVQSCCFTNINLLLFLPFSLPSPSLLPKLLFVVIQKFCYHGNVTSYFSSLLDAGQACCLIYKQTKELGKERKVLGSEHWRRLILRQTWLASLRVDSTELVDQVSDACVLAYQGRRQFILVKIIKKLLLGDGVCAHLGLHLTKDKESIRLHLGSYLFQYFLYYIMHLIVEIKWHMGWIESYYTLRDGHKDIVNFLTRLVYTSWLQIQACPRFPNQQGQSVNATWIHLLPSPRHEPCSHVIPGYKPMVVRNQWLMNQTFFSIFGTYIWLFKTS